LADERPPEILAAERAGPGPGRIDPPGGGQLPQPAVHPGLVRSAAEADVLPPARVAGDEQPRDAELPRAGGHLRLDGEPAVLVDRRVQHPAGPPVRSGVEAADGEDR